MTDQLPQYPVQASVQSQAGRWSLRLERDIAHSPEGLWLAGPSRRLCRTSELARRASLPG